jgi:hypothetical protein
LTRSGPPPIIPARRTTLKTRIDSESRRRSLQRAIERTLLDAIAESPVMHRALAELERAGLELRLAIDCRAPQPAAPVAPARARANDDAPFRIDGEDLRFLRSLGIDPTRRSRRRS